MRPAPRVLVSRTDRIGDVVLTLPLCGLLRAELGAHVVFLGREYTRPVLEACDAVDEVLAWDPAMSAAETRALVAGARADVLLHVFPRRALAVAGWRARVPRRVGTSRRAYHWLTCTRREPVSRRGSALHEAQLDVQLARSLLPPEALALAPHALAAFGRLRPRAPLPADVAAALEQARDAGRFVLAVHPRSLGSAREWPLPRWRALVEALPPARVAVLVTGSVEEGAGMRDWLAALPAHVTSLCGRLSLAELVTLLAAVDGMVAASTGPLHVAAAAGTRALGLYPPVRPMHAARWGPIGARAEWIEAPAPCPACAPGGARGAPCTCMQGIATDAVLARVLAWAGAACASPAPRSG